ncbi:MAG TPA: hypothetical protein VKF61_08145 [Candidatus Polarisedimenticolia bacterium]|nr:hypothetical protein [Candidatus Polarisedimenticolia bacterium]
MTGELDPSDPAKFGAIALAMMIAKATDICDFLFILGLHLVSG